VTLRQKTTNRRSKLILGTILVVLSLLVVAVYLFKETLLREAGNFMAPEGNGNADIAIVEGTETIETVAVLKGIELLNHGRAKHMIVVIHKVSEDKKKFGLIETYPDLVRSALRRCGLQDEQFRVMVAPVQNLITLTEAKIVLGVLSNEGVKSVILLSDSFHTRRSYLTYQYVGDFLNIKIIPIPYFIECYNDDWWHYYVSVHGFIFEVFKLVYYQMSCYIPLKLWYEY
jgi:hypothetical protein